MLRWKIRDGFAVTYIPIEPCCVPRISAEPKKGNGIVVTSIRLMWFYRCPPEIITRKMEFCIGFIETPLHSALLLRKNKFRKIWLGVEFYSFPSNVQHNQMLIKYQKHGFPLKLSIFDVVLCLCTWIYPYPNPLLIAHYHVKHPFPCCRI